MSKSGSDELRTVLVLQVLLLLSPGEHLVRNGGKKPTLLQVKYFTKEKKYNARLIGGVFLTELEKVKH